MFKRQSVSTCTGCQFCTKVKQEITQTGIFDSVINYLNNNPSFKALRTMWEALEGQQAS